MADHIRLATAADASPLARLRWEFRAPLRPTTEDKATFLRRCEPWMAAALAPGTPWRCWVAEVDGAVRGHLWLQLIDKIPNPVAEFERIAYVTNVFMQPAVRGRGLGEALVAAAVEFCRQSEVDVAVLWPTPRSRTLYMRHGFAPPEELLEAALAPQELP